MLHQLLQKNNKKIFFHSEKDLTALSILMEFQNFPLMKWHTAKTYVFRYVYICCIFLQNCRVRSNTSNVNTMIKSIQRVLHRGQKYADIWAEAFVISYKAVLY